MVEQIYITDPITSVPPNSNEVIWVTSASDVKILGPESVPDVVIDTNGTFQVTQSPRFSTDTHDPVDKLEPIKREEILNNFWGKNELSVDNNRSQQTRIPRRLLQNTKPRYSREADRLIAEIGIEEVKKSLTGVNMIQAQQILKCDNYAAAKFMDDHNIPRQRANQEWKWRGINPKKR